MSMELPSGRSLDYYDQEMFRHMVSFGFIRWSEKPFVLKSGIESHVYVYGREDVTNNPGFEYFMGWRIQSIVEEYMHKHFSDELGRWNACLIGIPTAGTVLAQAAAMVFSGNIDPEKERARKNRITHCVMREVKKAHGAHQTWVNGVSQRDVTYWLVDNVATDGASKVEAAAKLKEDGYPPLEKMPCLIFVDRQQGAVPRLQKEGFRHIVVVYNLLDVTHALGELGLWPRSAVKSVEEEIAAHQFSS